MLLLVTSPCRSRACAYACTCIDRRHFESCTRCTVVWEKEEESPRISSCGRLKGKYFCSGAPAVESLSLWCMIYSSVWIQDTAPLEERLLDTARRTVRLKTRHSRNCPPRQDLRAIVRQDKTFTQLPAKTRPPRNRPPGQDLHPTARQDKTFTQSSAKTRPSRDCPPRQELQAIDRQDKTFTQLPDKTRPRDCPLLLW